MKNITFRKNPKNSLHLYSFNNYIVTKKENEEKKSSAFCEKFINLLMIDGKKSKASLILYNTLAVIRQKVDLTRVSTNNSTKPQFSEKVFSTCFYSLKKKPIQYKDKVQTNAHQYLNDLSLLNIVFQAIENVKPSLEVRKVRIAGMTYQVPSIIKKKRQESLAIRWLIDSARTRKIKSKNSFSECLAQELIDAYSKQGHARQKRDDLHKLASSNRAYVRYRWW